MTILDERCSDVLDATSDPDFERLVLDLDALGTGSPSRMADIIIKHALAAHAQDLTQHGSSRPADEIVGRQRR